jgi:hypothetical protein
MEDGDDGAVLAGWRSIAISRREIHFIITIQSRQR